MRLTADEKGGSPLGEQLVALAGVIAAAVVAVTAGGKPNGGNTEGHPCPYVCMWGPCSHPLMAW
jgi:hypothetical protein